jgi:hypothetical protein
VDALGKVEISAPEKNLDSFRREHRRQMKVLAANGIASPGMRPTKCVRPLRFLGHRDLQVGGDFAVQLDWDFVFTDELDGIG